MKDRAMEYLLKNSLLHIGMIEPIRRGTADILYAETDGVLIKERRSNAYMISVSNIEKGRELIDGISECNLITAHQEYMVEYILDKFAFTKKLICVQAAYMSKAKLDIKEKLEIRKLRPDQIEEVFKRYNKIPKEEIKELLKNGDLYGGYKEGELIGFVGNHLEGSIGLLEIFPEYRRLGYGAILESHMVNLMLEKDLVPFGQIEVGNEKSIGLQKKLGFSISEDKVYWLF